MREGQNTSSEIRQRWLAKANTRVLGIVVILAILIVTGIVIAPQTLSALNWNAKDSQEDPLAVRRLPVLVRPVFTVDSFEQKRQYTGVIRAKQQANLGFEMMGRVDHILVDEGDIVNQGQALAVLDTDTLQAQKRALDASLRQAEAVLKELENGPRQQTIDSMKAQLAEAISNRELATSNLERRERLRGSAVSEEEYDRALFSEQAARDRVTSIRRQLDELVAGTRPEKVEAQKATIEQLQSSIEEMETQIAKGRLLAPFGGKIVERMIDPGSIVDASSPILKIVDFENLEAVIGMPVAAARNLEEDSICRILVAEDQYSAKLIAKIQQLEMATRTQNLIFELEDYANEKIIPGQLCQVEVTSQVSVDDETYSIPASSLTNGIRGLWSVLIVEPNSSRINKADVQIVYTNGKNALVTGSIQNGEQVIVDGTHRVVDGQHVEIIMESTDHNDQ